MNYHKQRLFEIMEKVNPEFQCKNIDEDQNNEPLATDVINLQNAMKTSKSVEYADSKIDTPKEFEEAFKIWISSTGFNPKEKPISISMAQTFVKNVMLKLGYK